MNYLAHAHLSFHHPEILAGNMISDFVKGKKQYEYPSLIQKGIRLHRNIDSFTDLHPATKKAKAIFKPAAGAYAGAFMDIVYDHFLALDAREFPEGSLLPFTEEVYAQLAANESILPPKFALMLPYMRSQNWLYHYQFPDGIEKSFGGMTRRARYLTDYGPAFRCFINHYEALKRQYEAFFPFVKEFASSQFAGFGIQ